MSTPKPSPDQLMDIASRVASETAAYIRDLWEEETGGEIVGRGAGGDATRRADKWAEDYIVGLLKETGIPLRVVTEEAGIIDLSGNPVAVAAVDPLDGSMNYVYGIPFASVSIAFAYIDRPLLSRVIAGCVSDIFHRNNYCFDNEHAYINGAKASILRGGSGFVTVYSRSPRVFSLLAEYADAYGRKLRLRVLGSAALEMIYAALGITDLFINMYGRLRNIDLAASAAYAQRLGRTPYLPGGEPLDVRLDEITRVKGVILGSYAEEFIGFLKTRRIGI